MATTLDRGFERDEPVELKVVGARKRGQVDRVLLYLVLIVIAVFFILPLVVVVSASLKYRSEVFTDTGLIPKTRASRTTPPCSRAPRVRPLVPQQRDRVDHRDRHHRSPSRPCRPTPSRGSTSGSRGCCSAC